MREQTLPDIARAIRAYEKKAYGVIERAPPVVSAAAKSTRSEGHARHTDPSTSHDAAAFDFQKVRDKMLLATVCHGDNGLTWDETVAVTGIDKATVSPRFIELIEDGLLCIKTDASGHPVKRYNGRSRRGQLVRIATDEGVRQATTLQTFD